ncbi:MAG: TRAP transporter small permease [Chromatiales bacterium]|nr:TRAP transporter small permease [Chromatiales bacterium]
MDPLAETESSIPLGRAERAGWWVETAILVALLLTMIVLAALQIGLRNFAGTGLAWADEALRLLVLWTALFGAVAASREDRHIRIDLLSRFLSPRPRSGVALLLDLFTAGVCIVLAWYSADFVLDSHRFGDTVLGGLPAWSFQVVLPLAFALIAWRYLLHALRHLLLLTGRGAA